MKRILCLAAPVLLSLASFAQLPCGGVPGVDVTISPASPAPGQPVLITIDNQSNQSIVLPTSCVFDSVHGGATCSAPTVYGLFCLQVLTTIPPGQSRSQSWDQTDDFGQQVASGAYSIPIQYYDASFQSNSCCVTFTIGAGPTTYCTAGTTTSNCQASMSASGMPTAGAPSGFVLTASTVEGQRSGLLFYGINGRAAFPWSTGTSFLCVQPPTQRTALQNSGGTVSACDGQLSIDFLAFLTANPGALGAPGAAGDVFNAQAWFRDPPAPQGTNLSHAIEFTLTP